MQLGGRIGLLYRSEVRKTEKQSTATAGLKMITSLLELDTNASYNKALTANNMNVIIRHTILGGTKEINWAFNEDSQSLTNSINSIKKWIESVTVDCSGLIAIKTVLPIYDLVTDPIQKNALKASTEKYFKDKELELLTPLYHGWKKSQYNDNFKAGEEGLKYLENAGYKILGVECYLYNDQKPGTIPLYHGWKSSQYDDNLKAGAKGLSYLKETGYTILGIEGYVYEKQTPETESLYHGWKSSKYNNTLGVGQNGYNYLKDKGYTLQDSDGYVYPGNVYP